MSAVLSVVGRTRYFLFWRYSLYTYRYGLAALCVVLCLGTGLMISRSPMVAMAFPALLGGIVAFLFIYHNFQASILMLLVITCIGRVGVGTGTGTAIMISFLWMMLIVVVWLARRLIIEKTLRVRPAPALLPGLLFVLVAAIAVAWSGFYVDPRVSVRLEDALPPRIMTVLTFLASYMAYVLVGNTVRSPWGMRFMVWWYIGFGAVVGLIRMVVNTVPFVINDRGQLSAFVGVMALSQALFNRSISPLLRIGLFGVVGVWVIVTFVIGRSWLSGWLPLFAGAAVVVFFRAKWPSIIVGVLIAAIFLANQAAVSDSFAAESEESGHTRLGAWENILGLVDDHLLFGVGPAGYKHYFDVYLVRQFWQATHNNYLDIIAQTGLVGITLYLWMWIAILWMAYKALRASPPGGFLRATAVSCFAGVCVTLLAQMLGDWVTPFAYTQGLAGIDYTIWHWMFAGLSVSVYYASIEAGKQGEVVVSAVPANLPMLPTPTAEVLP